MKQQIIKCDICKRILDREKESIYYRIWEEDLPGWAHIDYSMGEDEKWDICKECFKEGFKELKK